MHRLLLERVRIQEVGVSIYMHSVQCIHTIALRLTNTNTRAHVYIYTHTRKHTHAHAHIHTHTYTRTATPDYNFTSQKSRTTKYINEYCECCDRNFQTSLHQHILSKRHSDFVKNSENFRKVASTCTFYD
jgi:hypothetical protein